MRHLLLVSLLSLLPAIASAQSWEMLRGNCTPSLSNEGPDSSRTIRAPRRLPYYYDQWQADRIYRQLVILVSFSDLDFKSESPRDTYNDIFNKAGYNERNGAGCVADYFRCQSGGLFNLQFDVFGPYKVSSKAQPFSAPNSNTHNYGTQAITESTKMFLSEEPDIDFSIYDWDNDGYVNQVVYVFAGRCGNQNAEESYGYLWPNTDNIAEITTHDGKVISSYTASAETWSNDTSCGIGTICHEFSHSLGLPDIYPTLSDAGYSVVDEWDLMDGGNFTNYGWCPPNYSALEKMLLGWLTPVELADPTHIAAMKPVADGGEVYMIRNTANEYYLLENRQQKGWDLGLPGKGLAIFHVNYSANKWLSNSVNNNKDAYNYSIVHADNMDYDQWYDYIISTGSKNPYVNKPHLNNRILSTSAYPWTDANETVNAELTDTSTPAAVTFAFNTEGEKLMSKPITHITQNPDGTIAFDFMGGDNSGIRLHTAERYHKQQTYDLLGKPNDNARGIVVVRSSDGTMRKLLR